MNDDQRQTWEYERGYGRSRYIKRSAVFWSIMVAGPAVLCRLSFVPVFTPRPIPGSNLLGSIAVILYLTLAANYALFTLWWRLKEAAYLKEAEMVLVIDFAEREPEVSSWLD